MDRLAIKHLALAGLLAGGLIACAAAIEPEPAPVSSTPVSNSPSANTPSPGTPEDVTISTAPSVKANSSGLPIRIKPADRQTNLDASSIDLDPAAIGQQFVFTDKAGRGIFNLERAAGTVTFSPQAEQVGEARAEYTIKTLAGQTLKPASITVLVSAAPVQPSPVTPSPTALKVLFIGNSRTRYFDIPKQVQQLASGESRKLEVRMVAFDGWTLEAHWNNPNATALRAIREGGWDDVVLQELSSRPVLENAKFVASVKNFDAEIKKVGARTVLYENWWRKDLNYSQAQLSSTYKILADELHIAISPVGSAWLESSSSNPTSTLFNPDGNHATALGAYLTACEFYAFFYQKTPKGLPNLGVSGNTLAAQTVAWQTFTKLEPQYRSVPVAPAPTP